MDDAVSILTDFSKEAFDVELLDEIFAIVGNSLDPQNDAAKAAVVALEKNPDIWIRSNFIIDGCRSTDAKLFGLKVLTYAVRLRWEVITTQGRDAIVAYISYKIKLLASTFELYEAKNSLLAPLNMLRVYILEQHGQDAWPAFITDIVESSAMSESLCENSMKLLQLLPVTVLSTDVLSPAKQEETKNSLRGEFSRLFELFERTLSTSTSPSVINAALECLKGFVKWLPWSCIFETTLLSDILPKYLLQKTHRQVTVFCFIPDIQQKRPLLYLRACCSKKYRWPELRCWIP